MGCSPTHVQLQYVAFDLPEPKMGENSLVEAAGIMLEAAYHQKVGRLCRQLVYRSRWGKK